MWNLSCKLKEMPSLEEIIQIDGIIYFFEDGREMHIFKSDGRCNWSEISNPTEGRDIWLCIGKFLKTPDNHLAVVWEESNSGIDVRPRSFMYYSYFNGKTWSDPLLILIEKNPHCYGMFSCSIMELCSSYG